MRSTTYGVSMQADNASPTVFNCQEVISSITDGIRITHTSGTTGVERYVTAFLINGISDAHIGAINLGTSTSANDITSVGFKPSLVFFANAGLGDEIGTEQAHLSFGVAHNSSSDTVSQGLVLWHSQDNLSTSVINNYTSQSKIAAQVVAGTVYYTVSASDFDANGFSVTANASADSDLLDFMALKLPSADDAWVGLIQAATSTGASAITGVGFEPLGLGLVSADSVSLDTIEDVGGFSFALIDPAGIKCYSIAQTDASGATAATSEYSTSLKLKFDDTSTDAVASLVSLDADGFTLNYSNAASSASRILAFAIGEGGSAAAPIAVDPTATANPDAAAATQIHAPAATDPVASGEVDAAPAGQTHAPTATDPQAPGEADAASAGQVHVPTATDPQAAGAADAAAAGQAHTVAASDAEALADPDAAAASQAGLLAADQPEAHADPDAPAAGQVHGGAAADPEARADPDAGSTAGTADTAASDPEARANPDTAGVTVTHKPVAADAEGQAAMDSAAASQVHSVGASDPEAHGDAPGVGLLLDGIGLVFEPHLIDVTRRTYLIDPNNPKGAPR